MVYIDFSGIGSKQELHALLKEKLSLPEYYGNNLDALYDCLTDISDYTEIVLFNINGIVSILGRYADALKNVFSDAEAANDCLHVKYLESNGEDVLDF